MTRVLVEVGRNIKNVVLEMNKSREQNIVAYWK